MSAGYFESTYQRIATIAHERAVQRKRELEALPPDAPAPVIQRVPVWDTIRTIMGDQWISIASIARQRGCTVQVIHGHFKRHRAALEYKPGGNTSGQLWRLK